MPSPPEPVDLDRLLQLWRAPPKPSSSPPPAGAPPPRDPVDPLAAQIANEPLAAVMAKTADSEKASFDAQTFDGMAFRGDHIVSAFSEKWLKNGAPDPGVWLIQDSTGTRKYLIGIPKVEGATAKSPGTVVLRIKPVSG